MTYTRRGTPLTKSCEICKVVFERPYKMTLPLWEARRFCSQRCNAAWKKEVGLLSKAGKVGSTKRWSNPEEKTRARERAIGNSFALGYKHTDKAKHSMSLNKKNEKHPLWKENNASYSAFHKWLVKNYGSANKCENPTCQQLPSDRFEYALLHFREYTHDRTAYKMLCRPCHASYDSALNKLNVKL